MNAQSFLAVLALGVAIGFGGGFVEGRRRDTGRALLYVAAPAILAVAAFCLNQRFHFLW